MSQLRFFATGIFSFSQGRLVGTNGGAMATRTWGSEESYLAAPLRLNRPRFLRNVRKLAGITKNSAGATLASCTVRLFDTSTNTLFATTTSDGVGAFSFDVVPDGPFYIVSYLAGTPDVAGTTVNTLVPV